MRRKHWPAGQTRDAVALLLCLLYAGPIAAQRGRSGGEAVEDIPAYCSLVEVEKTQLSNAAIVTVKANGLIQTTADRMDFVQESEPGEYDTKPVTRLPMRIENARSALGSFVDINLYPISHLEITIPPDAQEGIGLILTVVLFTPGHARRIDLADFYYSGYLSYTDAGDARDVPVEILMSESQRDIIIIARSDRYIDVERQGPPQRIRPPRTHLEVGYEHGRLEVHAVSVTAAQLLNEISRQTGIRVSLTEPSPAVASLHLQDMTLTQALDSIARAYGLVLGRIDGAYALAPGWPTSGTAYHFATQRTFPVQYLRAETAANLLPNALDRYIQVDRDHNAFVATGAPALLDKIGADLALIDQPPPLIETEAVVVDMERHYDLIQELNVQFADGTTSLAWAPGSGDISFRVIRDPLPRVRTALSALEQRGTVRTDVQARVTAFNGQYARVFGGALQYFPYKTSRGRRQEITLGRAEVGVRLSGWFYTGGDGTILSQLYLRADNILSVDTEGLPRVARRYARSFLRLSDGDTVYIGGFTLSEQTTRHTRVPLLGNLPWVGALFQSRAEAATERALAVFLTVRLIDEAADVVRRLPPAASPAPAALGLHPKDTPPLSEVHLTR